MNFMCPCVKGYLYYTVKTNKRTSVKYLYIFRWLILISGRNMETKYRMYIYIYIITFSYKN